MDSLSEDRLRYFRPGHWPLLWLLIPILFGYILGATFELNAVPQVLIVAAVVLIGCSMGCLRKVERFRYGLWAGSFLLGVTLLGWAYWLLREPQPPQGSQPPPREVEFSMQVDRLFAGVRQNGQIGGLGTIISPPELLPEVQGQRVFFVVWPEDYRMDYASGAVVSVRGRFTALDKGTDDYGFSAFLFRSGVYYELDPGTTLSLEQPAPVYERWARSVNASIRDTLSLGAGSEAQKSLAGISKAMLLGRKEALDYSQKERFIESGTMHLFAVSGLHVGIISGVLFWLLNLLRVPRPVAAVIGLCLVATYVLIVGQPPSARRAFLMVAFFWGAHAFQRKPSAMSALLASALVILLWKPQELLRPGFQLSYAVVGGILLYGLPLSEYLAERFRPFRFLPEDSWSWWQKLWSKFVRWSLLAIGVSFAATVFSTPLTVAVFGVFAPGAIILNAMLLPLAMVALIVAAASAVFGFLSLDFLVVGVNHISWALNWLLDKVVALGLYLPGLFLAAEWRSVLFAPITLCLMFLAYLTLMHVPRPRLWFFWVPPGTLVAMLVIGLRIV